MKFLIARKIGMTQIFGDNGQLTPVTLLAADPCTVTQVKTAEKDGYMAIQVAGGSAKHLNKAQTGHLKASKAQAKILRELRLANGEAAAKLKVGTQLDVSQFAPGDKVSLSAVSKGKGFAGAIKRHNFHRGPMTHGSRSKRRIGSIGSMYPQKVWKGKKMAGRLGGQKVTLRSLQVALTDPEQNLLAVRGPVPGPAKGYVVVKG